jgi:anti-sigma factor RsiW
MMMHPRMQRLQAYAAGELKGDVRRRTAVHLAQCPRCRATVEWMDDVRTTARADVPSPPAGAWEKIAARAEAGAAVLLPVEPPESARPSSLSWTRAARVAVVALLLAGAAAAAMPGSWVRTAVEALIPGLGAGAETAVPAEATEATDATPPVTLIIEPVGGAVVVALERPDSAVRVHVQITDANELEVRARDHAATATFRSSPGRLTILDAGAGAITLVVPRTLPSMRVAVDGRPLLVREHGEVRVLAPTADTIGAEYILPVGGPAMNRPRRR